MTKDVSNKNFNNLSLKYSIILNELLIENNIYFKTLIYGDNIYYCEKDILDNLGYLVSIKKKTMPKIYNNERFTIKNLQKIHKIHSEFRLDPNQKFINILNKKTKNDIYLTEDALYKLAINSNNFHAKPFKTFILYTFLEKINKYRENIY